MRGKKVLGLLATALLTSGLLAGCGGSEGASSGGNSDTIKIGVNLALTGEAEEYGVAIEEGIDLAVKILNEEGVNGKKIELVKFDNKSNSDEAKNGVSKLVKEDKVVAVIGGATSENALAQAEAAQKSKIPFITPAGMDPAVTGGDKVNDFVFRTSFVDSFQATAAAKFASSDLQVKSATILVDSTSDYSKNLAEAFKKSFEENGGKVVSEKEYSGGGTDFADVVTAVKTDNPEMVYLPGQAADVAVIVKQAREAGIAVPFLGGDTWDAKSVSETAGAAALANTFFTNHYSHKNKDKTIATFVRKFKENNLGHVATSYSALGYDSVFLLADAITRAGSVDAEDVQKALSKTKDLFLITGTITIDKNHNSIKPVTVNEYIDGRSNLKTIVEPK